MSQHLSRADSTVGFFFDSTIHQIESICKIAIFQFPHSLVAKDIKDEIIER